MIHPNFTPTPGIVLTTRGTSLRALPELWRRLREDPRGLREELNAPVLLVPDLSGPLVLRTRHMNLEELGQTPLPSVFSVVKAPNALPSFNMGITLGRVDGNDLVIPHSGISRLHAYLLEDKKKRWRIFDAESRNGTFLNGRRLQPNVPRAPTEGDLLKDGDQLKLGIVEMTFLGAKAFWDFLREHAPTEKIVSEVEPPRPG